MSWKYPVGFMFTDSTGDLEIKILRRRINDDDVSYYVVEKTYPNGKFHEAIMMENILVDEVRRGVQYVDPEEDCTEELFVSPALRDFKQGKIRTQLFIPETLREDLPSKRGRPKGSKNTKPAKTKAPTAFGEVSSPKFQLNNEQRRRLAECRLKLK
jgi:hypothetical protein